MDMPLAHVVYLNNLRTQSTHLNSGDTIITDAPIDNNGKGEAFSPTDLLSTSLLNCMMTIIGILANRKGWNLEGMHGSVTKTMADAPRRVCKIEIELNIPDKGYTEEEKKILEKAALTCPVAQSLHPSIAIELNMYFTH